MLDSLLQEMRMTASVLPSQMYGSQSQFGTAAADLMYSDEAQVYEDEWGGGTCQPEPGYPDTQEFLSELQDTIQQNDQQNPIQLPEQPPVSPTQLQNGIVNGGVGATIGSQQKLGLANDYQGMGGPSTVPLYSDRAFQKPEVPLVKENSLLKQMFMEPTDEQILAYHRVYIREQINTNKQRLKWSIFLHYLLVFFLISKLLPDILDRLDIFIMEIEELFVPAPYLWEWLWLLSVPVTFFGLSACKKSNIIAVRRFMLGSLALSLLPIIIGMVVHGTDVIEFLFLTDSDSGEDSEEATIEDEDNSENDDQSEPDIVMWQGYPYSMLWYAFFLLALQVHTAELYFANNLMK